MEIIPKETLLFTEMEIEEYCTDNESTLSAVEIYEQTGGWAGCVDNMIRLAAYYEKYVGKSLNAIELRKTYEIDGYIQQEILGTLSKEEHELMKYAEECPWLEEALCQDVWNIENAGEILEKLERKGILERTRSKRCWKLSSLFRCESDKGENAQCVAKYAERLTEWYEKNHYIKEAVMCAAHSGSKKWYRDCVIRHYAEIPTLNIAYEDVLGWKENIPQLCWLRGVHYYEKQDFQGLDREITRLEKQETEDKFLKEEILLNLYYLKPDFRLEEWLEMLKASENHNYRLYNMLGNANTYLCGLRDLTDLFACPKKEENAKAKIWKAKLGAWEWKCYQLARLDYYLETERQNALHKEDYEILLEGKAEETLKESAKEMEKEMTKETAGNMRTRQFHLARLYLLCKMQRMGSDLDYEEQMHELENQLLHTDDDVCREITEAILCLYAPWLNSPEKLARWLKRSENMIKEKITGANYFKISCMAKGYLLLHQHEKVQRILKHLIPYLREYKRQKLLTEMMFEQAVVNWDLGSHGQALQNVIEAFIISGNARYVDCYASYGKKAKEPLEAYVEWLKANSPEGWHRKKKYQYGNVLRMPVEDYMETVLRCVRREARAGQPYSEETMGERLTMMETIILQDIGRGLSNNEICEELNLKLPTVKSHIYSLYKKLGTNSRVQAVLKAKEIGILK